MGFDWIAFLTDYGRSDGFVASCRGVIAKINPAVRVIDITHDVPPQDVRHGAVVLSQTLPYLPPSVVVAVVDPGVGTARRGIAGKAGEHLLVGPDNGLLSWAAEAFGGVDRAVELTSTRHRLETGAATFDGRDVFAPAAAHLAAGVDISELGPDCPADSLTWLPAPIRDVRPGVVESEAHYVDHFGNVALAVGALELESAGLVGSAPIRVTIGEQSWTAILAQSFADVAAGELVALIDSAGHLSLAVNQGRAVDLLGVRPGQRLSITANSDHGTSMSQPPLRR